MFSFLKNKPTKGISNSFLPAIVDIHSHILPGIDDGAPDVNASIVLIKGLMEMGIKKSIATPHIMADIYKNDDETIENALQILRNALQENEIDFEVQAAAEYMMDDHFFSLLQNNKPLRCIQDNYVLTEFPYRFPPTDTKEMVFKMINENYIPILAHPERYSYFHKDYSNFNRMEELGFRLQLNLLSLTGYYGKYVRKAALYLLEKELISFVGTDLHHVNHLACLQDESNLAMLQDALGKQKFNQEFLLHSHK